MIDVFETKSVKGVNHIQNTKMEEFGKGQQHTILLWGLDKIPDLRASFYHHRGQVDIDVAVSVIKAVYSML